MKKSIILLIIVTVFILTGCKNKEQMTSFIPTQMPEEVTDNTTKDETEEATETEETQEVEEATPTPKEIHVGQTTPMYVKLDEYGAFLNVRPTASTEGAPVGFLVHAEKVEVIEIVDGWANILYNDAVCYINADFLVDERPEYLEAPTPTPAPKVTPTPEATPTPVPEVKPEI